MTDTIARLRSGKLTFETMVNLENAVKLRKGENVNMSDVVSDTAVYTDIKKGMQAGKDELINVFGTTELSAVTEKIVKKGQLEVTQDFRDEALENRKKQIIDFLARNAVDAQTGRPFTPDLLESSLKQAGVKIEDKPVDKQISNILEKLKTVIPLKVETKKLKIKIPAEHTGRVYGLLQEYKEKEEWLGDGSLQVVLNIPVGIQSEFYDKLNSITHGSAITEEVKDE
jgi:ribosome maturation protein SDO1